MEFGVSSKTRLDTRSLLIPVNEKDSGPFGIEIMSYLRVVNYVKKGETVVLLTKTICYTAVYE